MDGKNIFPTTFLLLFVGFIILGGTAWIFQALIAPGEHSELELSAVTGFRAQLDPTVSNSPQKTCSAEAYLDFWETSDYEIAPAHAQADNVFVAFSKMCFQDGAQRNDDSRTVVIDVGSYKGYSLPRYAFSYAALDEVITTSIGMPAPDYGDDTDPLTIYAMEPLRDNIDIAQKTVKALKMEDFVIFTETAVSDFNGSTTFLYLDGAGSETSRILGKESADSFANRNVSEIDVPVITLDAFAEEHKIRKIEFVKINTEGYDGSVIHGMENILRKHSVAGLQYVHQLWKRNPKGHTLKTATEFLAGFGYHSFVVSFYERRPVLVRIDGEYWNDIYLSGPLTNIFSVSSTLACSVQLAEVFAPPECTIDARENSAGHLLSSEVLESLTPNSKEVLSDRSIDNGMSKPTVRSEMISSSDNTNNSQEKPYESKYEGVVSNNTEWKPGWILSNICVEQEEDYTWDYSWSNIHVFDGKKRNLPAASHCSTKERECLDRKSTGFNGCVIAKGILVHWENLEELLSCVDGVRWVSEPTLMLTQYPDNPTLILFDIVLTLQQVMFDYNENHDVTFNDPLWDAVYFPADKQSSSWIWDLVDALRALPKQIPFNNEILCFEKSFWLTSGRFFMLGDRFSAMREIFWDFFELGREAESQRNEESKPKLLLYSRQDSPKRKWLNMDEMYEEWTQAHPNVFSVTKVYDMGSKSTRAQAKLFYDADVVLCPHGAHMANSIFSRPNTTLIEMTCVTQGESWIQRGPFCESLGFTCVGFVAPESVCVTDPLYLGKHNQSFNITLSMMNEMLSFWI